MTGRKDPAVLVAALTSQAGRLEAWLAGPGADVASADGTARCRAAMSEFRSQVEPAPTDVDPATLEPDRGDSQRLAEQVVRMVVVSDDVARLMPDRPGPDIDRNALRIAVRTLLDRLAERAPGRSVEVRVPPYAAVQCVAGTRHTRGTPPSVVETDPVSWIRLATGRVGWADLVASGAVSASGERCDLSRYLPVLAPDPRPRDAR